MASYKDPSLLAQAVKNPPAMQETLVWFLGWEDPLEKAIHSSIPGLPLWLSWLKKKNIRLQCGRTGLGRSPGKGKGYPLQYSGLENSMDCIMTEWLSDFHFHFHQGITKKRLFNYLGDSRNILRKDYISVGSKWKQTENNPFYQKYGWILLG